jgi:transposase-like protein
MRISSCRVKEKTQDRLAEFFVGGVTARSAADLARVNRKTAAYFFHRLRQIIARQLEDHLPLEGLVEVDESYFGGVRKGKRGRGAAGKVPVFGILKRGGKVHSAMIPDVRKDALLPIIRQKVVPDSIVYTDSYPADDVLDVSEFHHHQDRPLRRLCSRSPQSRQRNRELLEPGQAHAQPKLSAHSTDTTAFRKPTFRSFSSRPNFASITENPANNCEPSNAEPNSSLSLRIWDNPKNFYRSDE